MDTTMTVYNRSTALLIADSKNEIEKTARKLLRLTPNGNRLNADQATDLAVYALLTGYNPFNNECYYMDKVGPVPGIAGYRVKAMAWLQDTNPTGSVPRLWEEYRPAESGEADFDPDNGDVAWVCILHDSIAQEKWEQRIVTLGTAYRHMGGTFQEVHDAVLRDIGPCPSWTAVGVVHADEHFSGNIWRNNVKVEGEYKPEMWDRNERAKKRAAKGCYRKGFPAVNFSDREFGQEGDIIDGVAKEVREEIKAELEAENTIPREYKPASEILHELGFDSPIEPMPEQPTQPSDNGHKDNPVEVVAVEHKGTGRPLSPETLKRKIATTANQKGTQTASKEQRGLTIAMLEKCFAGEERSEDIRHSVQEYLTGFKSSKDIPDTVILALLDWLKPVKDSGGDYNPDFMAAREAKSVWTAALENAGQQTLI